MTECEDELLKIMHELCSMTYAWCVLPNHYHLLLKTERIKDVRQALALLHGRSSYGWNGEDTARGRKVWFNCFESPMKSERHLWAEPKLTFITIRCTTAMFNTGRTGHGRALPISCGRSDARRPKQFVREYPILEYGKKWDVY